MKRMFIAATLIALAFTALADPASAFSDEWVVSFDTPARDGNVGYEIVVEYDDAVGKRQKKTIKADVTVPRETNGQRTTTDQKRVKIQAALQAELDKDSNKIFGQPAVTLTGAGGTLVVDPNAPTRPDGTTADLKLKRVKNTDHKSGEKDEVVTGSMPNSRPAIAMISAEGSLTGKDSDNETNSIFTVVTGVGEFSRTLNGEMTKEELFYGLADAMSDAGLTVWLDVDGQGRRQPVLYILVTEGVSGVGAGSTDDGLTSSCSVMTRY